YYDVERNLPSRPSRVTFDPATDWFPAWAPGAQHVFFASTRSGVTSIFVKVGADQEEKFEKTERQFATYPNDVSSDGTLLAATRSTETGYDLFVATLTAPRKIEPFLVTRFNEAQPRFAPNARWIAYTSDDSGQFEVYVRPYPATNVQPTRISPAGGMQPEWRRDGQQLFYVAADGKMMAVPVSTTGATLEAGPPTA